MIGRIVLAVVVAVVVGLLWSALLGPLLVAMHVPIADTVGTFFTAWGWVLGLLAGLWYFFANPTWGTPFGPRPTPRV